MSKNPPNLTKPLSELNVNVQDLIKVELDYVRQVARASNGQFLIDRDTIPATQFMDKYFAGFEVDFLNERPKRQDKKPSVRRTKINTSVKELFPDLDTDMASKRASDTTRYITEIPFLFSFLGVTQLPDDLVQLTDRQYLESFINLDKLTEPSKTIDDLLYCLPKVVCDSTEFRQNYHTANTTVGKILSNMQEFHNNIPVKFSWAANDNVENKETNNSVDIGFYYDTTNPCNISGLQIKKTSELNGFNLSAADLGFNSQHGQDLFQVIAPQEFTAFWQDVVNGLTSSLNSTNNKWYKETDKYSILLEDRNGSNVYHIKAERKQSEITQAELLNLDINKGLRRVVGDYYQANKDKFKVSGAALWDAISTKIYDKVSDLKNLNTSQYYMIGGFLDKPYYHYSYSDDKLSFVPRIDDIKDSLSITFKLRPQDNFHTGVVVDCTVKTGIIVNDTGILGDRMATTECRIRYHQGCFASEPQMMIQGMKDTHNIWKEIK